MTKKIKITEQKDSPDFASLIVGARTYGNIEGTIKQIDEKFSTPLGFPAAPIITDVIAESWEQPKNEPEEITARKEFDNLLFPKKLEGNLYLVFLPFSSSKSPSPVFYSFRTGYARGSLVLSDYNVDVANPNIHYNNAALLFFSPGLYAAAKPGEDSEGIYFNILDWYKVYKPTSKRIYGIPPYHLYKELIKGMSKSLLSFDQVPLFEGLSAYPDIFKAATPLNVRNFRFPTVSTQPLGSKAERQGDVSYIAPFSLFLDVSLQGSDGIKFSYDFLETRDDLEDAEVDKLDNAVRFYKNEANLQDDEDALSETQFHLAYLEHFSKAMGGWDITDLNRFPGVSYDMGTRRITIDGSLDLSELGVITEIKYKKPRGTHLYRNSSNEYYVKPVPIRWNGVDSMVADNFGGSLIVRTSLGTSNWIEDATTGIKAMLLDLMGSFVRDKDRNLAGEAVEYKNFEEYKVKTMQAQPASFEEYNVNYVCFFKYLAPDGQVVRSPASRGFSKKYYKAPYDSGKEYLKFIEVRKQNFLGFELKNVELEVYKTLNNGTSYHLIPFDNSDPVESVFRKADCPGPFMYAFDDISDEELQKQQQIPSLSLSQGFRPSEVIDFGIYKTSMVYLSSENLRNLRFSNPLQENTMISFSLLSGIVDASLEEDWTCFESLDDKIIIFSETSSQFIQGEPPSLLGVTSLTSPEVIIPDVGCADRRHKVYTQVGVLFKSNQGFYRIDRGLKYQYIGEMVKDYEDQELVKIVPRERNKEVVFVLSTGTNLVYNYEFNRWSIVDSVKASDAIEYKGSLYVLGEDALVKETKDFQRTVLTPPNFSKVCHYYGSFVETNWIRFRSDLGAINLKKIGILGRVRSPHTFNVLIKYNFYENRLTESFSCSSSKFFDCVIDWTITPRTQRVRAIKVQVWDTDQEGSGESFSLDSITLDISQNNANMIGRR